MEQQTSVPAAVGNPAAAVSRSSAESRFFRDLKRQMHERMTTDVFALFAAVLRERVGRIDPRQGEQSMWDYIMIHKDIQVTFFSLLGLVASLVTTTVLWYVGNETVEYLNQAPANELGIIYIAQIVVIVSTITALILIWQKYQLLTFRKRMEWSNLSMKELLKRGERVDAGSLDEPGGATTQRRESVAERLRTSYDFWKTHLRYYLAAELFIHLLIPLVWMKTTVGTVSAYDALQMLIFLRLYLLVNVVFKLSAPFQRRREIMANNALLQRTGFHPTVGSSMKIVFYKYPYLISASMMIGTLVFFGFLEFIAEKDYNPPFSNLANCIFFALITFTTTGYGNYVPVTTLGKIISVGCGALGILITVVFGGVLTSLLRQSREQRTAMQYVQLVGVDTALENSAAKTIQLAYRQSKTREKHIIQPWNTEIHGRPNVVYASIRDFKARRWQKYQAQKAADDPVLDAQVNNILSNMHSAQQRLRETGDSLRSTRTMLSTFAADVVALLEQSERR